MPPEDSPTARALRALEILQARPGITASELAARLGVTERATRRYVEVLREAGVPVESQRGPYGGYRLGRGAKLPPVAFTQEEALALVMAVLDGHPPSATTDGDDVVGGALGKVIRALPEGVRGPAAALREQAAAVPDHYSKRADPLVTSQLVSAIAQRRQARLGYQSEAGSEWESDVDPWAVVVRHGRWYLLCHSHHAGAVRTYRVDRISSVVVGEQRCEVPDGLDPVTLLEQHLGVGWQFETRVAFDAPVEEVRRWVSPPMGRLEATDTGCVLVGSTRNPTMYASEWLARLPLDFRVEGGPELCQAMTTLAARLTAAIAAGTAIGAAAAGAVAHAGG